MRQVVLDTETTGLEAGQGHRIIEIGCVEVVGRRLTGRHYHQYINPEREVDAGALAVHGITDDFLSDKPVFANVAEEFLAFVRGAELIIHNAAFDVGFINMELTQLSDGVTDITTLCNVIDTLAMARERHPGQRNSLDALCKRYEVDNSQRQLHGALLDAEILADVYLAMTGGQASLLLGGGYGEGPGGRIDRTHHQADPAVVARLLVPRTSEEEQRLHAAYLDVIRQKAGVCLWDDV